MMTNWLKARQTKYTGYVTLYIAVILAVLVAVNFLGNRHNKSYDSTANKRYSLSEQTEKVIGELTTDVKITYFDQSSRFIEGRDLLDRYENLSPRLSVEYVDPDQDPQRARDAGISGYGTIYVEAGAAREEAEALTEQDVTNAVIRALKGDVRTVCVVQGSGEHDLSDFNAMGYSNAKDLIESSNYQTRAINLLESPEVPSDCTVLLVGGPRFDYLDPAVAAIESYMDNGGRTLFLLRPPLPDGQTRIGENPKLGEMIAGWGVRLHADLVEEEDPQKQRFGMGPEILVVTDYDTHEIVRTLGYGTLIARARTMEVGSADGVTLSGLFSSSSRSYATTNLDNPSAPGGRTEGPLTLAAAGSIEVNQPAETQDDAASEEAAAAEPGTGAEARFVVVGSSEWVANGYLRSVGNQDLFLNMLNWLSSDEDLISIRPKEQEDRRLELTRDQATRLFWMSVVFPPILVIGAGIAVWWRRR